MVVTPLVAETLATEIATTTKDWDVLDNWDTNRPMDKADLQCDLQKAFSLFVPDGIDAYMPISMPCMDNVTMTALPSTEWHGIVTNPPIMTVSTNKR